MKERQPLFSITISQFLSRYKMESGTDADFIIISRLTEFIDALSFPLRIDALIAGICLEGNIKITVNLKEYVLTENTCIVCFPEDVIGLESVSDDFQGAVIAISLNRLREMNIDLKKIIPYYVTVKNYPHFRIGEDEKEWLRLYYELIMLSLKDTDSERREDVVTGLFTALIFKIVASLDRANLDSPAFRTKSKEYYFARFMELLSQDFRKHRNVGYYAGKLSVTPKYLSSLIKEISGSSAAAWIDEYTIMEASILLKFSDKNIQQIADELNFPSQSFFSKYFKHHTGKTPTEYREHTKM